MKIFELSVLGNFAHFFPMSIPIFVTNKLHALNAYSDIVTFNVHMMTT